MKLKKIALFVVALFLLCFVPVQANDFYDNAYEDGYEEGYEEGEEDGYEAGYEEGYVEGRDKGYEEGREHGYEAGYEVGHNEGYEKGTEHGKNSKTSILDLIKWIIIIAIGLGVTYLVLSVLFAVIGVIKDYFVSAVSLIKNRKNKKR